jgi:hypothetical protein
MIHIQNTASKVMIAGVSKSAGSTATGFVDTLGFGAVSIDVHLDSQAATSNNPTLFNITESVDTVVSNATAITGLTGDATDGFVVGPADSVVPYITRFNISTLGRKRYLHLTINPLGTAGVVTANAVLSRAGDSTVARALIKQVVDKA